MNSSEISESMKNIHRRLQTEFKDSVHIFPDDKRRLLLVPDRVSLQDVVLENQCLLRELDNWKSKVTNFNNITDQSSAKIRSVIKEDMNLTHWPYHPSNVSSTSIPCHLESFLTELLTVDPDCKSPFAESAH